MRLTELFRNQTTDINKNITSNSDLTPRELAAKQMQQLSPGQTITGEVLSKSGSDVQLKLMGDQVINAKIDQNISLEPGKNISFEVKSNGQSLMLSPLYTNTASQNTAMKALDMAFLPVNSQTMEMTTQMMKAGLSVDRNSLQQVFKEMSMFETGPDRIVDLHKLGLPVNENNLSQMEAYANFQHKLGDAMKEFAGAFDQLVDQFTADGKVMESADMMQEVFELVAQQVDDVKADSQVAQMVEKTPDGQVLEKTGIQQNQGETALQEQGENANTQLDKGLINSENGIAETKGQLIQESLRDSVMFMQESAANELEDFSIPGMAVSKQIEPEELSLNELGNQNQIAVSEKLQQNLEQNNGVSLANISEAKTAENQSNTSSAVLEQNLLADLQEDSNETWTQAQAALKADVGGILEQGDLHKEAVNLVKEFLDTIEAQNNISDSEKANLLKNLLQDAKALGDEKLLSHLVGSKSIRTELTNSLEKMFAISPKELEESKSVENIYKKLSQDLRGLTKILEHSQAHESQAGKMLEQMNKNVDFLNDVNQLYNYVQLPIRLQQGDAHGDLYVYTNKKKLSMEDGEISALLHLDMEHLGPLDVYVAMQTQKVSTKFYLQDDEMLDFLEQHMELLTSRLEKRGYQMTVQMQLREKQEPKMGALQPLTEELGVTQESVIAQYAFDVRT